MYIYTYIYNTYIHIYIYSRTGGAQNPARRETLQHSNRCEDAARSPQREQRSRRKGASKQFPGYT